LNIQLIVQLLVLVDESRDEGELTARLESLLAAYGFQFYGVRLHRHLHQLSDMGETDLLSNWPATWRQVYISRKYPLIDPNMRMLGMVQRPFRWRDAVLALKSDPHRQRMERMMQEASRYGLHDGYLFPIHGRNGLLGWTGIGGKAVDLSPTEIALFDAASKRVFWRLLELKGMAQDVEVAQRLESPLTRREMEVILHLADGLTSNEIAKTLEISNHTVDWYINGLQEKLRAKNRQHVVAIAFRLGLVT
jgi:LuxR family transcriptional regulator, quorum-sensing system regulator SdiA